MGQALDRMTHPQKHAANQRAWIRATSIVDSLVRHDAELFDLAEKRADFRKTLSTFRRDTAQIKRLLPALPPALQDVVTHHLACFAEDVD